MRQLFFAIIAVILLAGCADNNAKNYTASKPGITDQQKSADLYQCAISSGAAVNVANNASHSVSMQTDDVAAAERVTQCLKARGYTVTAANTQGDTANAQAIGNALLGGVAAFGAGYGSGYSGAPPPSPPPPMPLPVHCDTYQLSGGMSSTTCR